MGREIEGDRETLLPGGEIAAIEGVRFLRGGKAGILPDRPRLGDVHGRIGAAQVRRDAREAIEKIERSGVVRPVNRFHRDTFRG